jgi:hypothetical protein
VDAGVGPTLFPAVEIALGFFQTLEAQALQRRFLRVAYPDSTLPLRSGSWMRQGMATAA